MLEILNGLSKLPPKELLDLWNMKNAGIQRWNVKQDVHLFFRFYKMMKSLNRPKIVVVLHTKNDELLVEDCFDLLKCQILISKSESVFSTCLISMRILFQVVYVGLMG